MSGHSHWSSIKHQKGAADAKRGKVFSRLSRQIIIATKEKGKDSETNPKLRMAIEQARSFNMPKDNIERAIKKGAGEIEGGKLETVIFEAIGPGNSAIIIEAITDNKNRSLSEIRKILTNNNSKLANEGSIKWLFERKGMITIKKKSDEEELKIIESGAEDVNVIGEYFEVQTKPEELELVKKNLLNAGLEIESFSIDFKPKEYIETKEKEKNASKKLFEDLDENNDIQEIYSNMRL